MPFTLTIISIFKMLIFGTVTKLLTNQNTGIHWAAYYWLDLVVIVGHKKFNSGLNGLLAVLTLLQHLITSNHLHFMIFTQHSSSSVRHQNHKHNDVSKMTLTDQGSERGPWKDLGLPVLFVLVFRKLAILVPTDCKVTCGRSQNKLDNPSTDP